MGTWNDLLRRVGLPAVLRTALRAGLTRRGAGGAGDSGRWGENEAERHLRAKGYRILGRRVRVGRRDELDLVARDGEVLVFVEVKTRASEVFGRPLAAVNRRKRQVTSRAAVRYLRRAGWPRVCFRFDVVEVVGTPADGVESVRHIENAFPLDRRYDVPG